MARVAATEDAEGVRDEEAVDPAPPKFEEEETVNAVTNTHQAASESQEHSPAPKPAASTSNKHKYVATVQQVHDAFDSVNVLRYSQPCHLQGLAINSFIN